MSIPAQAEELIFNVNGEEVALDVMDMGNQPAITNLLEASGFGICARVGNFAMDRLNARFHNVPIDDLIFEIELAYVLDSERAKGEGREPPQRFFYDELIQVVKRVYGMEMEEPDYGKVWGTEVLNCLKAVSEPQ